MSTENKLDQEKETKAKESSNEAVHVHGPHCNHGHHEQLKPIVRSLPKIGRNDPCLCGSGKKYKKCCGN